jgi:hypothetical protein
MQYTLPSCLITFPVNMCETQEFLIISRDGLGWECMSVVDHLSGMLEALNSLPSTENKNGY